MKSRLLSKKSLIAVIIAVAILIGGSFVANKTVVQKRLNAMAYAKEYGQDITEDGLYIVNYSPDENGEKTASVLLYIGANYGIDETEIPSECKGVRITSIDEGIFDEYTMLKKITLPQSVKQIDSDIFSNCKNLREAYIPSVVDKISDNAFSNCKNVTLFVEKGSFAEEFAKNNKLKYDYYISDKSTSENDIDYQQVVSDKRYKNWYYSTFFYNDMLNCAITRYVEIEGDNSEVTVPDKINGINVTAISSEAFMHDSNVKKINLPSSIVSVGHDAFNDCKSLEAVIFTANVKSIDIDIFYDSPNAKIYAPNNSYAEQYAKENSIPFEQYD